ncbi:unnamed protein product, partial [marine sediment metagenome]
VNDVEGACVGFRVATDRITNQDYPIICQIVCDGQC